MVQERRFPEVGSSRKTEESNADHCRARTTLFPPRSDLPVSLAASGSAIFPQTDPVPQPTGPRSAKPFSPAKSHPSSDRHIL